MELTTLHYLYSSIPQVLGTTSAILIAIMFFRIEKVSKYLIGDGIAILNRFKRGEKSYQVLKGWREYRLEDANIRENIPEIKEILKFLCDTEISNGIIKSYSPRGFQYMYYDRFLPTEKFINCLTTFTIIVVLINVLTIILSIFFLTFLDVYSV